MSDPEKQATTPDLPGIEQVTRILAIALRESGDLGEPLVAARPDAPTSHVFAALAERIAEDWQRGE